MTLNPMPTIGITIIFNPTRSKNAAIGWASARKVAPEACCLCFVFFSKELGEMGPPKTLNPEPYTLRKSYTLNPEPTP